MEVIIKSGTNSSINERAKEIQEFFESGGRVKGLVDLGLTKVPQIFINPNETLPRPPTGSGTPFQIPVIDLKGGSREEVVNELRQAAETWGFFQVVNHGIPAPILEDVLEGVRRFHERPAEVKTGGGDAAEQEGYLSYLKALPAVQWRDSLSYKAQNGQMDEEAIPQICRQAISDGFKSMVGLKDELSELVSLALGLKSDFIASLNGMKSVIITCHYYPACPESELTMGTRSHTDPSFLTILLQNNIGGLQIFYQNQWVDVPYVPGSLIVNFGDLIQLITNGKFKSIKHRVLSQATGPRVTSAFFFHPAGEDDQVYGPLKELVSKENPPIYKAITVPEYLQHYRDARAQDTESTLSHFMLST